MPSLALAEWESVRKGHIDQLLAVHRVMGSDGVGRRWRTEPINWSLVLILAAQFQGYCRELHDQAAEYFAVQVGGCNTPLVQLLFEGMTSNRELDRGNAHPGNLGSDFGRLGIDLWPTLKLTYGQNSVTRWNNMLQALNTGRNALAHSDLSKMQVMSAQGLPLSRLRTIQRFYAAADGIAVAMDAAVGTYLKQLVGGAGPW